MVIHVYNIHILRTLCNIYVGIPTIVHQTDFICYHTSYQVFSQ